MLAEEVHAEQAVHGLKLGGDFKKEEALGPKVFVVDAEFGCAGSGDEGGIEDCPGGAGVEDEGGRADVGLDLNCNAVGRKGERDWMPVGRRGAAGIDCGAWKIEEKVCLLENWTADRSDDGRAEAAESCVGDPLLRLVTNEDICPG